MKKYRSFVLSLIWFIAWISLFLFSNRQAQTPLFEETRVSIHDPVLWLTDNTLVGDGETTVYVKSYGYNHVVYSTDNQFVATGTPLGMDPGESKQIFESHFKIEKGVEYDVRGSSNIYTLSPTTITFRVDRFGYPVLSVLSIIILVVSAYVQISLIAESRQKNQP